MAASQGYSVKFSAVDGVSSRIEQINKRLRAMQAPVERLNRRMRELSERTGLSRLSHVVSDLTQRAVGLAGGLARVIPALGAITGAASLAGMYRLVSDWAEFGRQTAFAAQRIGVTAGQLSALQGAAQLAGGSAAGLTTGLETLGQTMYDAIGGRNPEAVVMLRTIGVEFRDTAGHARSVADVLPEVADKIAAMKSPYSQARVAAALFGGAAADMLPFLRQGSDGIARYNAMAVRYGVVNDRAAKAASDFAQDQTRVKLAVEGMGNSIAQKVAPVLGPLLVQFAEFIARNREFIAGRIDEYIKRFSAWLQSIDWKKVKQDLWDFGNKIQHVVDLFGGWQSAAQDLMLFMAGKWALGMTGSILPVIRLLALIPGFIPAAALAAAGIAAENERRSGYDDATKLMPGETEDHRQKRVEEAMIGGLPIPDSTPPADGGLGGRFYHWMRRQIGADAPDAGSGESSPGGVWRARANALMQFYEARGYTPQQAAGVVGNFQAESSLNSSQSTNDRGKEAYGLAQWRAERQALFRQIEGVDIHKSTWQQQADFFDWELHHTESATGNALAKAGSAGEAGAIVVGAERPLDTAGERVKRAGYASEIYAAQGAPIAISSGAMMAGGGANTPANGTASINVHVTGATDGVRTSARSSGDLFPNPPMIVTSMPTGAP